MTSSLSLIASYASESEESDDEPSVPLKPRLPLPDEIHKVCSNQEEEFVDDSSEHDGRVRSFPHQRGNWCSLIYVPYEGGEEYQNLISCLQDLFNPKVTLKPVEELHVSLSRTFVLFHHWIDDFFYSAKVMLKDTPSFPLIFDGLKAYTNDTRNRTFLSLTVSPVSGPSLQKSVASIDKCLSEYRLEPYYEDASFHMSILWCLGDKLEELENLLEEYNVEVSNILIQHADILNVDIHNYVIKAGNKFFNLPLV